MVGVVVFSVSLFTVSTDCVGVISSSTLVGWGLGACISTVISFSFSFSLSLSLSLSFSLSFSFKILFLLLFLFFVTVGTVVSMLIFERIVEFTFFKINCLV